MKYVYIDADSFKNPQFVSQAIRIYMAKAQNISFLIKGKKEDLITISNYDNVKIVDNISKKDLNSYRYQLIANDNPLSDFNGSTTLFRFINQGKSIKNLLVSLPDNINENELKLLYEEAKKLYQATTKNNDSEISFAYGKGYKTSDELQYLLKKLPNFKEVIPLDKILNNDFNIIFIDSSCAYYLFNIVESLTEASKDEPKKKEKMSASFFSKKLFTFSRSKDEIDYDSLFLYYTIEKDNSNYIFHIKRLANLTALFKILYDIDEL